MNSTQDTGQNNINVQNLNFSKVIYTTTKFLNHKYVFPMLPTIKIRSEISIPHTFAAVVFSESKLYFPQHFHTAMWYKGDFHISKPT